MQASTEDITVPWGQAPDPLDAQFGKWRMAVFQDVQESIDTSKLYFLYDPIADDSCITTGGRKGMTSLVVFDTNRRCFVREVPIRVQGRVKFLFALAQPSQAGGTSLVVVTHSEDYGQYVLHFWRVDFQQDGFSLAGDPKSILNVPVPVSEDYICSLREDIPELVVISGPGMEVTRVNANANYPQEPTHKFTVPGAELNHFYDGFLSRGSVHFLSASPDGHLDYSRLHILNLDSQNLTTQFCQGDQQRGNPPARRQAGLDSISGFILLAGGEIDYGHGNVQRLVDYWVLDLQSLKWNQIPAQMPVPLIEPRVTAANSGNVYVWGDFDDPLPGMNPDNTHVRILRVKGLNTLAPPSYNQAVGGNQPYPGAGGSPYPPTHPGNNPYAPEKQGGYPGADQSGAPPYPGSGGGSYPPPQQGPGSGSSYPQQPYQNYNSQPIPQNYGDPSGNAPPQYPYYPPQEKKKDCVIQ